MTTALIAIGSNIDRDANLPAAIRKLRAEPFLSVIAVSRTYESAAIDAGGRSSLSLPPFHNAAVKVETGLSPVDLRLRLREIEEEMGRIRLEDKYAARPIDLDLVWYGRTAVILEGHEIPDGEVQRYPHLALPLADVASDWLHPHLGLTIAQMAASLNRDGTVPIRCV